ncbi:hypothetical protein [Nocardiopsis sp. NRRL B-16309]|uniref:hypothetical protein n=1 Tax=Nocardiopsis sp. NRRL B-16309 TaxID=1519494 RepID=UPI0006AFFEA7|nr:hypothetical protein [Nocardiopsis sp. NRRL B-16309]KOX20859.1 hypothetical protein ADL05_05440 [Nocardiopsis sp. NRRL B-16309]
MAHPRALAAMTAVLLALTAGCSAYDEDAHRSDVADVLGVDPDEMDDQTWQELRETADTVCASDERQFSLGATALSDGGDPARALSVRRVHVEHVCPDRLDEYDDVVRGLTY